MELILANRSNYGSKRDTQKIKYIVIHYTANDGDTARNNCIYFQRDLRPNPASAHYFVDDNGAIQSVPDHFVAYSVGAHTYRHPYCRNSNSISIELCDTIRNGIYDFTSKTIKNAVELTKTLMRKYNVPIENVIRHYDVTGKICPKPFVVNTRAWNEFKKLLVESNHRFSQGQRVLVDVPISIAYKGSEKSIVDSNGYQFWIHNSVIQDDKRIYGLGDIAYVGGDDLYIVQIFDDQFWCRDEYLSDKF